MTFAPITYIADATVARKVASPWRDLARVAVATSFQVEMQGFPKVSVTTFAGVTYLTFDPASHALTYDSAGLDALAKRSLPEPDAPSVPVTDTSAPAPATTSAVTTSTAPVAGPVTTVKADPAFAALPAGTDVSSTGKIAKLPHPGMRGDCPLAPYVAESRKAYLTGNTAPDIIVITSCVGTGPGPTTVEIYRQATPTKPPMRATLVQSPHDQRGPYPQDIDVSGKTVSIGSTGYKAGECMGCASLSYRQAFKFDGLNVSAGKLTSPGHGNAKPFEVTGLDGDSYDAQIWNEDRITQCAAHAYGAAVIAFLAAHPCRNSHRSLAIVWVDAREAALLVTTVSFAPSPGDTYGYAASMRFQKLESAPGTGGMNDLLREGKRIPGSLRPSRRTRHSPSPDKMPEASSSTHGGSPAAPPHKTAPSSVWRTPSS